MKKFMTIAMSMIMVVSTATAAFAAVESAPMKSAVSVSVGGEAADKVANEMQNKDGLLISKIKDKSKNKATLYSGVMNKQEFEKVLDEIGSTEKEKKEALKQYDESYKAQKVMTATQNVEKGTSKNDKEEYSVETTKEGEVSFTFAADNSYEKMDKILTNDFINAALKMGYLSESSIEFNVDVMEDNLDITAK